MDKDKVALTIYKTRDYDRFFYAEDNRLINEGHVKELKKIMQEHKWFRSMPMICNDRDQTGKKFPNNKLLVIDRQHGLEVARLLGIEVIYCVDNKVTPEMIHIINGSQRRWTARDFLLRWIVRGKKDYREIAEFITEYGGGVSDACEFMLCGQPTGGWTSKMFNNGEFRIKDLAKAHIMKRQYDDFRSVYKEYKLKPFLRAMIRAMVHPKYNHGRMMKKMNLFNNKMRKHDTAREYLDNLNVIYNHNQKSNRVCFTMNDEK